MEVDIEIDGAEQTMSELAAAVSSAEDDVDEAEADFAEDLLRQFIRTSPVDSGYYRSQWELKKPTDRVVKLVNSADYAPYLVYPNSRMVGAEGANSRGILHNVRGMAFKRKTEFRTRIAKALFGGL